MKKIYILLALISFSLSSFAQVEGAWRVKPQEAALSVGPVSGAEIWWSISEAEVAQRTCFFDDAYIFNSDGTFSNELGDETWLEAWQGIPDDGCGIPVAPHDGSNLATWEYNPTNRTITLTGVGAFLGLSKAANFGELLMPSDAPQSITYPVNLTADEMIIDINYGGDGIWHFELERTSGTTSVENIVENQFSFSPNPATNEITIISDDAIDIFTIRDITGQVVMQKRNLRNTETLNISELSGGLYILESRTDNTISVEKMVIN